ncbi:MbnP family protein [Bernardetia sp.]|uniref:MbnP family protein n=1 Tax=Bernardetia sp. TaxID=1937974 RepID=UPI0025BFE444|nr:MbnP family protein [Bernardetia sp.]
MNTKINLSKVSLFALFMAFSLILFSCKKDSETEPEIDPNKSGTVEIKFDNIYGQDDFTLNTEYTNSVGENFTVDMLQYYISNIVLKTEDGREYVVPQEESYFLIKEHDANTQKIQLPNVPEGNYNEVTFTIGVDSLRSTMLPENRTGVLDIGVEGAGKEMYWRWNSGYIFFKMEGVSSAIEPTENNPDGRFFYHIGGFGGYESQTINNIRTITLSLGRDAAKAREEAMPSIHIVADMEKVLGGKTDVSLREYPVVMFNPFSLSVSENYMKAFEYHHVHNEHGHE